jgi:hypothetical protein
MENLLYFYIIFSYLFVIGGATANNNIPVWNIVLSPIVLPILLGRSLALLLIK